MNDPKHVTTESADIQLGVHSLAKFWIDQGFCPSCIARQIIIGAAAVAQDAARLPADAVHEAVDDAFAFDANHIHHGEH
jgi:hypothetical protein